MWGWLRGNSFTALGIFEAWCPNPEWGGHFAHAWEMEVKKMEPALGKHSLALVSSTLNTPPVPHPVRGVSRLGA